MIPFSNQLSRLACHIAVFVGLDGAEMQSPLNNSMAYICNAGIAPSEYSGM